MRPSLPDGETVTTAECTCGALARVAPLVRGGMTPVAGSFRATLLVWWWKRESPSVVLAARRAGAGEHYRCRMPVDFFRDGKQR